MEMRAWLAAAVLAGFWSLAQAQEPRPATSQPRRERPNGARPGGDGPRREGDQPRPQLPPDFQRALDGLNLTDVQREQLRAKLADREAALTTWQTANAERIKAVQEGARKAQQDMQALDTERRKVNDDADAAVLSVLTSDQRAGFETGRIVAVFDRKGGDFSLNLTDAQLAAIRTLQEAAVKDLVRLETTPPADPVAARREILTKFSKAIFDSLTPEQQNRIPRFMQPWQQPRGPETRPVRPEGDRPREGGDRPRTGEGERPRPPATGDRPPVDGPRRDAPPPPRGDSPPPPPPGGN
jgi:hypothetical protein